MGRAENRKAEREARKYDEYLKRTNYGKHVILREEARQETMKRLEKNGITAADLEKAYKDGYDEASKICAEYALKMTWSTIFTALHEEYGFGTERLKRVLFKAVDVGQRYITADEAVKALHDATGFLLTRYNDVL